jgi:hypothetical protein
MKISSRRAVVVLATVAASLVWLPTLAGTAGAKAGGGAPGTVSCSTVTGTVSFKPPLITPGTTKSENASIKVTLSQCTASDGSSPTKGVLSGHFTDSTDDCPSFFSSTSAETINAKIKWKGATASEVAFPSGTISATSESGNLGVSASGGNTTGSFAGEANATFVTSITEGEACISGHPHGPPLTKVSITSGNMALGPTG